MSWLQNKSVAVIVAHPDDEVLWAGGTILSEPLCNWFILCLSRVNDINRSVKFKQALFELHADGIMGDINDDPDQKPILNQIVEQTIIKLLPKKHYDLIITHNPTGEYTRHIRHEEVSKAVIHLWKNAQISTNELWTFAYEDANKQYLPKAIKNADINYVLPKQLWQKKYTIITHTYGFLQSAWEAKTTPIDESFWKFTHAKNAESWIANCIKNKNYTY